jgi:quinol monooxygenase YgiN
MVCVLCAGLPAAGGELDVLFCTCRPLHRGCGWPLASAVRCRELAPATPFAVLKMTVLTAHDRGSMVLQAYTRRAEARPGSAATFLFRTCEFVCRPDAADACEAAVRAMIEHADRVERGTRFVASFRDADNRFHHLVTAVFEDEQAKRVHDASPASERFRSVVRDAAADGIRIRSWEASAGV